MKLANGGKEVNMSRYEQIVRVKLRRELRPGIFLLTFIWHNRPLIHAGQYIMLEPKKLGSVMWRPFSVYRVGDDEVSILIQVKGPDTNTEKYSRLRRGDLIKLAGPCGNPIVDEESFALSYNIQSVG